MNIRIDKLLKKAEELKARGLFDKAKRLIKKIFPLESSCDRAYILLGDIEYKNKNLDDAVLFYNMAVKSDKKCFQGWINLAVCYIDKELLKQAHEAILRAVKLKPDISHSYEILAEIMLKKGDTNKAFQVIKRCQNKHESYYNLSMILMKKGDYARSKKALLKAIEIKSDFSKGYSALLLLAQKYDNLREALIIIKRVETNCRHQDYIELIVRFAGYLHAKGDIKHLGIVLGKFEQTTSPQERISLNCFKTYFALEKYSEAFQIAEELLIAKKTDISLGDLCDPWLNNKKNLKLFWRKQFYSLLNTKIEKKLGIWKDFYLMILEEMLRRDRSLHEVKRICRQFKGCYGRMRFPMVAHLLKCDLKQALKELQIIIDCAPNDWLVCCTKGEALIAMGKTVEGFKQFKIAIGMSEEARGKIEAWKGVMYLMTGEYKKALKSLEIAVELNAPFSLCWRGVANFKLGYIQEAFKDLKYVVEKIPKDIEAKVWKAEILRILGKFNEALGDLKFILKCYPNYDFALFNRALLYYALGDYTSMRKDFSRIDAGLKNIILYRLKIKRVTTFSPAQIYKVLISGLKMAKGNRRHEKHLLRIQFPELSLRKK